MAENNSPSPALVNDASPKKEDFEIPGQGKPSVFNRFKNWYGSHKKLTIPLSVLVLLIILGLVPYIRFKAAGLVLKQDLTIKVVDATANIPVSGVKVTSGSLSAVTDGSGKATLRLKVGHQPISLDKKYYQSKSTQALVPILKPKGIPQFNLTATGRQVEINVTNLINSKVLSSVSIAIAGTTAKTDKNGSALLVVPANISSAKAALSLSGYNDSSVDVKVSNSQIEQNKFTLTPAGQVYFLSKLSGTIDIVKTNLDGTGRQTVLAGTGKEDDTNTVLLASRDWKYLSLLANRDGADKLYVMNTADEKLLVMDESGSDFTPVGWYNHYFIYEVSHSDYNAWQSGAAAIKSYNADTGQTTTLAATKATGTSNSDAAYEFMGNIVIMGNQVVYSKTWYQYPGSLGVSGQQNVLASVHADGTGAQNIKSVDASNSYIGNQRLAKPNELDFGIYSSNNSASTTYWTYNGSGVTQNGSLSDQSFFNAPDTYLLSPSGTQTFWEDERDGKNVMFISDQNGGSAAQIATLSNYETYGWYTDNYLLVSKGSDELYIIPVSGIKSDSAAIKISDYHKPNQNFYGYGGGYGGL